MTLYQHNKVIISLVIFLSLLMIKDVRKLILLLNLISFRKCGRKAAQYLRACTSNLQLTSNQQN